MVITNRAALRNNGPARITLIIIILLAIHSQVDAYLYYNGTDSWWVGLSLLHYHLMGGLFLLFARYLLRISVNLKLWTFLLLGYTVLRVLVLVPEDVSAYENYSDYLGWVDIGIIFDSFASNGLNIAGLSLALIKINKLSFTVQPDKREQFNYLWLKNLLTFQIGLYIALVILTILSFFFSEQWLTFWKIESMISGFFFFVLAFFAIRFPIFSVHGDFKDLGTVEKKYAKSSLTAEDSHRIWKEVNRMMEEEKLYLNPEYRLNELAQRMDRSIHHISQVINQQQGGSFSDFLNGYRIREAQGLLKSDRTRQLTILAIALEAGFNSKTTFYNAFKKETGLTPSQFMKLSKESQS